MGTYAGDASTYHPLIFTFTSDDLVLGGDAGISNIPTKNLADNSSYLKKFSGRVVTGSGAPSASTLSGFHADADVVNNTLYLNTTSGSYFRPNDSTGSTWTNLSKVAVQNVAGLSLNNAGDDSDYLKFVFDETTNSLRLVKPNNTLGDLTVGKVVFSQIEGSNLESSNIVDDEILLLYEISSAAQNQNAQFVVKRLDDLPAFTVTAWNNTGLNPVFTLNSAPSPSIAVDDYIQIRGMTEQTGESINGYYKVSALGAFTVTCYTSYKPIQANTTTRSGESGSISKDNSAMVMWNESSGFWELKTRDGTLLSINVAGLYINGVLSEIIPDRVVRNTLDFQEIFGHTTTGSDVCYLKKPETGYTDYITDEWIIVRPNVDTVDGSYLVQNHIEIPASNLKIDFYPGASFKFDGDYTFRVRNDANMEVYKYNHDKLHVYSENTKRIEGEFEGDYASIVAGDPLFTFSGTGKINRERNVMSIVKTTEPDTTLETDMVTSFLNKTAGTQIQSALSSVCKFTNGGNDYIAHAYILANDIYLTIHQYNTTTKQFEIVYPTSGPTAIYVSSVSPARTFSKVFVTANASRLFVFGYDNAASVVRLAFSNGLSITPTWTTQSSSFQLLDSGGGSLTSYDNFKFMVDDSPENIYGFLWKSGTKDFIVIKGTLNGFGLYTPVNNGYTTSSPTLTGVETKDFSVLDYDGSTVLLAYCKLAGGIKKLFLARMTKSTATLTSQASTFSSLAGANLHGELSGLVKVTASNLYVFFTETISPYTRNNVLYSKIDFTVPTTWVSVSHSNLQIADINASGSSQYDQLQVILNEKNKYLGDAYPMTQLLLNNTANTTTQHDNIDITKPIAAFIPASNQLSILAVGTPTAESPGIDANYVVTLETTGLLPVGLVIGYEYYVLIVDANHIRLSTSPGGSPVSFTGTGSGTATIRARGIQVASWNAGGDLFTVGYSYANFKVGDRVYFRTNGTLPTTTPQIVEGGYYFIKTVPSAQEFSISDTPAGTTIDIGTGATGIQWVYKDGMSLCYVVAPDPALDLFYNNIPNLADDDIVLFDANGAGTLPTGIVGGHAYYVVDLHYDTGNSIWAFGVSYTRGGSKVDFTDVGVTPFILYKVAPESFAYATDLIKVCTYVDPSAGTSPTLDNIGNWDVMTTGPLFPLVADVGTVSIAQWDNDHLFLELVDTTDSNKNYLMKVYNQFSITPDIPPEVQDLDDVLASDNIIKNLDLELSFLGQGTTTGSPYVTTAFRAGNLTKSKITVRIEDGYGGTAMDFQSKVQGLDVDLQVNDSNSFVTGVKELSHSYGNVDVMNTGTKAFDTCKNVAVQGFRDGDAVVLAASLLDG